jgi:hypothetical protein
MSTYDSNHSLHNLYEEKRQAGAPPSGKYPLKRKREWPRIEVKTSSQFFGSDL